MLYGITGAHRSGKSTLARKLAEDLGIEFYSTSTTEVARKMGFDPVAPMTLDTRMDLQFKLLEHHLEQLHKLPRPLIVDRTPLDMLAYTLGEFHMSSHLVTSQEILDRASLFHDVCLASTAQNYDMLYYLKPLSDYVIEDGKPAPNIPYQRHIALLIQGALTQLSGQLYYALVELEDFEERNEFVHDSIVGRIDAIDKQRATMALN